MLFFVIFLYILAIGGYFGIRKIINLYNEKANEVIEYNNEAISKINKTLEETEVNEHQKRKLDTYLQEANESITEAKGKLLKFPFAGSFSTIVATLASVILLFNSYITVPKGHVSVADLFGKIQTEEYTEGFHFVNPLLNFTEFDIRDIEVTITGIEVPAQDKLKSKMDVTFIIAAQPTAASDLLGRAGTMEDVQRKYVIPKARSLLREAGKAVTISQDFFLDHVQVQLQQDLTEGMKQYLEEKGVNVKSTLIRDIDLPEVVRNAIIQTKQRQEEIEQEKAQLAKAEQVALKQVKEAEAREKAAVADANAKRTLADAEAYRVKTEYTGRAEGIAKLKSELTTDYIQYLYAQGWNGVLPTTMLGSDQNVLMSLGK